MSIGGTTKAAQDATQTFSPAQAAFLILLWGSLAQPAQLCRLPSLAAGLFAQKR